jgi:hypothetical protein
MQVGHMTNIVSLLDGPLTKASKADGTPMPRRQKYKTSITLSAEAERATHKGKNENAGCTLARGPVCLTKI